jgi:hypothetical protein
MRCVVSQKDPPPMESFRWKEPSGPVFREGRVGASVTRRTRDQARLNARGRSIIANRAGEPSVDTPKCRTTHRQGERLGASADDSRRL